MRGAVVCLVLGVIGCAADLDRPDDAVIIGPLTLAPPAGWVMREPSNEVREWSPVQNDRGETITVIVGRPILGGADRAFRETRVALRLLPEGRIESEHELVTNGGIAGARFEVRFRPDAGGGAIYRRSHVVLFAGDQTFHVLYTAREADAGRAALDRVLDTIQMGS